MRGAAGFLGIVVVLGAAYFIYDAQLTRSGAVGAAPPQQQIDVTGIKASLLEIGQAQRIYVVAHGAYGTLDQLRADSAPHLGVDARGYVFDVQPNGAQGFKATATPADSTKPGWPMLTIDETMQVTSR
ncbi:MAG: hypothetical protein EHM55_25085 [Acidobacteria bacterium]|nr:MAG: hypothetical protein EHM55_25085 [Acidobacteriota bacterium]